MEYDIVVTQKHGRFSIHFKHSLALKQMIRHACPHQQVVCTLVELDLAADHVVRGCWESIGHSNPKLLSLRRRVNLYDLAI